MSWRWLLAPGAEPDPDAEEALRSAAARRPDALVVSSRVHGPGTEPWPELFDRERALTAARDGLLALRAVPAGSLLVREDVLAAHGEPHGPGLAWSLRVLGAGGGYLAPESVVRWPGAPSLGRLGRLRLALLPGLAANERLWLAYLAVRGSSQ